MSKKPTEIRQAPYVPTKHRQPSFFLTNTLLIRLLVLSRNRFTPF